MRLITTLVTAAILATAALPTSWAAGVWSDKKFVYRAEGKKLPEVFQDFAASQSLPVVIDAGVEGIVNASFDGLPENFLKAMSKTYGVIWYFDGVTLFVYPSRAMQSQVFRLRGYDQNQVKQMLSSFGMGDSRFPLRYNEAEQTVLVYGPPRHIELVASVLDTLEQTSKDRISSTVRVVPLKYAVAADRKSGDMKITGLATLLNNIFNGKSGSDAVDTINNAGAQSLNIMAETFNPSVRKRRAAGSSYGLNANRGSSGSNPLPSAKKEGEGSWQDRAGEEAIQAANQIGLLSGKDSASEKPHFQADEATNSIVIKANPDRMRQYENLVKQLDVAQDMVEIEATIIDVSTDEFESLGVEWDYTRTGQGRVTMSPGDTSSAFNGTSTLSTALSGANITTLVGDAGRQLLSRIRALEGTGKARILSRPKVLGSANRPAKMTNKRVASVKVAGNLDVNLFSLEAGTTLEVLPQIITYADRREVKLTLFIEDGNFESATVDQVPIIKRTEIRTEAVIREGESLLIGGISVESDFNGRSGLPGISRVPVLGALFRHDEGSKRRNERLFLLTPKVINVEGAKPPYALDAIRPLPQMSALRSPEASQTVRMPKIENKQLPKPDMAPVASAAPLAPVENAKPKVRAPNKANCEESRALGFSNAACGT
jgi:type III secretion protein C